MNKTIIIVIVVVLLGLGSYFVGTSLNKSKQTGTGVSEIETAANQPERKPEIYGKVKSIIGNEITITKSDPSVDPTADMTQADKQKYMKSLDEADRTKLKETILNATLGDIKVTMAVGMPMIKKTAQGPDASTVAASLADLKVGGVVSVWLDAAKTDRSVAEFVKISYSN